MWLERILAFIVALIVFAPLISRVVRLANRTWEEREHLEPARVRQVVILTPVLVFFVFILFYLGIIFLLNVVVLY